MPRLCFYFQLHQPYRLGEFNVFEIGNGESYFLGDNKEIFCKVAVKSYLPMLTLLLNLVKRHSNFKFTLSCSGVFLEQAQLFEPRVITLLQKLAKTGQVEFLAETYYHSLAALYSPLEFKHQVQTHLVLLKKLFGVKPQIFRNSELVYSNEIAKQVVNLGFKGMLTEAVDRYLLGRERTQVFWSKPFSESPKGKDSQKSKSQKTIPLLLKHAPLSDDIAFRFSDRNWPDHPLSVEKYLRWLEIYPQDRIVNLFMDFETFGEHQWEDTGIFKFFEVLIDEFADKDKPWNEFVTPSQVLLPEFKKRTKNYPLKEKIYDVPKSISWADIDRDLTAWVDNDLQQDSINQLYDLEKLVMLSEDEQLIRDWRRLQTSDHFYYMCTKWAADGDVHAYFSPYESPFEAYRRFSIVLRDLMERIGYFDQKTEISKSKL